MRIKLASNFQTIWTSFRSELDAVASAWTGEPLPLPAHYAHAIPALDRELSRILDTNPSGSSAQFDQTSDRTLFVEIRKGGA